MSESEQRGAAFIEHPDCLLLIERDGSIFDANRKALEVLGYTMNELRKLSLPGLFTRPAEAARMPSPDHPLEEERLIVVYMIPKSGAIDAREGTLRLIPVTSEGRDYAMASWQSTVSTSTHEALLIERHRYRSLFEQAHDAVFILDLEGRHLEVNQRAAELLGYTVEELSHLSSRAISADPDQSTNVLGRLLAGEEIPPYDRRFKRKDGSIVDVEVNVELVRDGHGRPVHIQSMARDITERKRSIARIRELADQRELLLREVYHRVKNSMATVISMIEIEAGAVQDIPCRNSLEAIGRRVRSIQVVYDSLLLSEDHQAVRLDDYLRSLVESLQESYGHSQNIAIATRLVPMTIPSRMTFAVGIVVNELVTNAVKYAFPDSRRGTITVSLSEVEPDSVRLAVTDDGVGHDQVETDSTGFGSLMIESLVEQLRGTLSRHSERGTTVEIVAPKRSFELPQSRATGSTSTST